VSNILFPKPKTPDIQAAPAPIEPIEVMEEEEDELAVQRREKKKLLRGGRRSTILSGISQALKKRLGE